MLAAPEPPAPTPEPEPQNTGGTGWIGGGGNSGGGSGGSAKLAMEIEENCAGKEITVSVLNPSNNPAKKATVTVYTPAWKTVEEQKSDEEGKAVFVLEAGEYTVRSKKSGYMVDTKQITVEKCAGEIGEDLPKELELSEQTEVQKTLQKNQLGQETEQVEQNLQQSQEQQETIIQTGLFLLEENRQRTGTAVMAGLFSAMIIGALLYVREKVKRKQNLN